MSNTSHHKGAVSIFVVVFTALLITIVTVSFVRLMVREQQRASDNDLSKSAYDSAMVGVEDAKRALARIDKIGGLNDASINNLKTYCNGITPLLAGNTAVPNSNQAEVPVQATSADASLNQVYTCVKVQVRTEHYKLSAESATADKTQLVPLKGVGTFNQVRIEWFSQKDIKSGALNLPTGTPVLSQDWPANRPPVLETQLIQTGQNFDLDQFDVANGSNSNTNTLFLYPKNLSVAPSLAFSSDIRRDPKSSVTEVRCTSVGSPAYFCSATISLPEPIGGTHANRANTYLRLVPRYKGANIQVTLLNNGTEVLLDGVQPRVDSTGRASDVFRRVEAYVQAGANAVYPEAAIDISGNLCKTFAATDRASDYQSNGCNPDPIP